MGVEKECKLNNAGLIYLYRKLFLFYSFFEKGIEILVVKHNRITRKMQLTRFKTLSFNYLIFSLFRPQKYINILYLYNQNFKPSKLIILNMF